MLKLLTEKPTVISTLVQLLITYITSQSLSFLLC